MPEYILDRYDYYYYPGAVVSYVINGVVGIIEFMLVLRLVLQLLAANPASQFIAWVYSSTAGLMGPFVGAFPALSIGNGILDFSIILAMIGYAIIGSLVLKLLSFLFVPVERPL